MKLLSTSLRQVSALILLGSIMSVSLSAMAEASDFDKEAAKEGYAPENSTPYDDQTGMQRTSQPVYNETFDDEPEDEDDNGSGWDNHEEGNEEGLESEDED